MLIYIFFRGKKKSCVTQNNYHQKTTASSSYKLLFLKGEKNERELPVCVCARNCWSCQLRAINHLVPPFPPWANQRQLFPFSFFSFSCVGNNCKEEEKNSHQLWLGRFVGGEFVTDMHPSPYRIVGGIGMNKYPTEKKMKVPASFPKRRITISYFNLYSS